MTNAEQLMKAARTAVLLDYPFFGSLALRLQLREDPTCSTAWTDGVSLGYSPSFVESLTARQRAGLIAHEVLHNAHLHPWRRGDRDLKRWNQSCDLAINAVLEAAGLELPPGRLIDPQYAGLSAEAIYGQIPPPPAGEGGKDEEEGKGESGSEPGDDPGGSGEVRDAPAAEESATGETEWPVATLQAVMQAKLRGELPAGLDRLVARIKQPACRNLVAALAEFVLRSASEDYRWSRPNTRYLPLGLYLPSLRSDRMPPVAAGVDTSGSIPDDLLTDYVGALQTVLDDLSPEALHVYACDAAVTAAREYRPGERLASGRESFPGGGGTDFRPVFERITEEGIPACAVVYLTDLQGRFPEVAPEYPTLWVIRDPSGLRPRAPFGEVLFLDY